MTIDSDLITGRKLLGSERAADQHSATSPSEFAQEYDEVSRKKRLGSIEDKEKSSDVSKKS